MQGLFSAGCVISVKLANIFSIYLETEQSAFPFLYENEHFFFSRFWQNGKGFDILQHRNFRFVV